MIKPALGSAIALLGLALSPASAQTISLFSTGVDAAGAPLAGGSLDPHYSCFSWEGPLRVLTNQAPGPYVQSSTSRWVWLGADGLQAGIFNIDTTFTLTAQDIANGVTLQGELASDNGCTLFLNGNDQGFYANDFTIFTGFSASSGFVVGTNVLRFTVDNQGAIPGNFGGLNVDNLRYTIGAASASAPEPATLALVLLGGTAIAARRKKGKIQ